jgi:hypothetical protein
VLAWSAVPVALLVIQLIRHGGVLSGSEGPAGGADQLFYMDSIRQSGAHVLIANHFDLALGARVFLHPLYLLAGLLWRLGVPLPAALWALKLVAAPAFAVGAIVFAARYLDKLGERAVALLLALFYMSPIVPLLVWTGAVTGFRRFELELPAVEGMPGWLLWGGEHAVVAMGLLALALVGAGAIASARVSRATGAWTAAGAAFATWLHPWQGATFILVAVALAIGGRSRRVAARLAITVLAALVPLIYEAILVRADAAWRINATQTNVGHVAAWMFLAALLPLAVLAVIGARAVRPGPGRTIVIAWPLAALALYLLGPGFRYHALNGITIPLAVLAVVGWRALRSARWLSVAAASAAIVPAAAFVLTSWHDCVRSHATPYSFTAGEHDALRYLEHTTTPGGVLARYYMGMAVPAFTGRRTWVGNVFWTPDFRRRALLAEQLFSGSMPSAQARLLVKNVGARFLLADCRSTRDLGQLLGPMVASSRHFGCATTYVLRR